MGEILYHSGLIGDIMRPILSEHLSRLTAELRKWEKPPMAQRKNIRKYRDEYLRISARIICTYLWFIFFSTRVDTTLLLQRQHLLLVDLVQHLPDGGVDGGQPADNALNPRQGLDAGAAGGVAERQQEEQQRQ